MDKSAPSQLPQQFIVIHRNENQETESKISRADIFAKQLDFVEKFFKILSSVLIPLLIAYFGWQIEETINNRSLNRDYVQIAIDILKIPKEEVDSPIRDWAVDLLAENAPTELSPEAIAELKGGAPLIPVSKVIFQNYIVQDDDTLQSIAERMITSVALMESYGITQSSLIPGTTINIPVGNPAYCSGRGRPYAVKPGDSAYNIAQRFNTTAQLLQSINSLDANYTLKLPDIICVP